MTGDQWIVVGVVAATGLALLAIAVAPWRRIRDEPPLDEVDYLSLLSGEQPRPPEPPGEPGGAETG